MGSRKPAPGTAICWSGLLAALAFAAMAPLAGEGMRHRNGSLPPPAMNPIVSPAGQAPVTEHDSPPKRASETGAERRKQIAADSATLLKLATDLKAEVNKSNKDTLSLTVIRKAEEIEKLARSVKEKMKLAGGTS